MTVDEIELPAGLSPDAQRLFRALLRDPHRPFLKSKDVAEHFGVRSGTLDSRFFRAGLPTLKRLLGRIFVFRVQQARESGDSISAAFLTCGASSAQVGLRTFKLVTGGRPSSFTWPADQWLKYWIVGDLISHPNYRDAWAKARLFFDEVTP